MLSIVWQWKVCIVKVICPRRCCSLIDSALHDLDEDEKWEVQQ